MTTCSVDGCDRKHEARGYCKYHWRVNYGKRTTYRIICASCNAPHDSSRPDGRFCSDACKGKAYEVENRRTSRELVHVGPSYPVTWLPAKHPVMRAAKPRRQHIWHCGTCAWCDDTFTDWQPASRYCSIRCSKRASRARRRAREHNTANDWRWSDFMRLVMKFDHACAYCLEHVEQPDPDHVVPLSKGGADSISNLLPSCRACNCDKRDLLLHEWNGDRLRRGLKPRITQITADPRYNHLTHALLISPAA